MPEKENLLGKFKRSASRAKKRAEDGIEQSRIRTKIKELARDNEKLYRQMGEAVYRSAEKTILRASFDPQIAQIESNYAAQKDLYYRAALISSGDGGLEKGAKQLAELAGEDVSADAAEAPAMMIAEDEEDDDDEEEEPGEAGESGDDLDDIQI